MNPWLQARSILVVRMDNAGDIVMMGPALRAIKEANPRAHITLLASPAGATASRLLPWIDEVIEWRAIWQDVGNRMDFDSEREFALVHRLREGRFDAALIFSSFSQCPHVPGYMCYLAGIPLRAGDSSEFGGASLSLELRDAPYHMHQVDRNLRLVEAVGFPVRHRELALTVDPSAASVVRTALRRVGVDPDDPFVVVHPGASAEARRYPARQFGEAASLLLDAGIQVVIAGADRDLVSIQDALAAAPAAASMIGETDISEFAELIRQAAVVVCNNSLPLHIADALATPLVVLYSGTDLEMQWAPRHSRSVLLRRPTACHPCYRFTCPIGKPCLDIDPREVAASVQSLMSPHPSVLPVKETALYSGIRVRVTHD